MNGFTDKCKDCKYFSYYSFSEEELRKWRGEKIDGICSKHFPRGYVGRKPPHPKYSHSLRCFQFEEGDRNGNS